MMLMMPHCIFDLASQSHPLPRWYTTGVSRIVLVEGIIDVSMLSSSTDIRTRGKLMPLLEQLSH